MRKLKSLEEIVPVSVVHWHMGAEGWTFEEGRGATGDPLNGAGRLHQIYAKADPHYTGRVTVPSNSFKRSTLPNIICPPCLRTHVHLLSGPYTHRRGRGTLLKRLRNSPPVLTRGGWDGGLHVR